MTKIESTIREIAYSQQAVYNMLSDLSNIQKVQDKIPQEHVKDLTFTSDSISISTPMGAVKMVIVNREEPKEIKFETQESPFNFWIQILPVDETSSKMKLTIKADLNPFIAGMVKKPLQEGIEKIADALQLIHYE